MKCIAYPRPDGGITVIHPIEGARLARSVVKNGETIVLDPPQRIDTVFRQWPVDGAQVEWAETEDEFAARIARKDMPPDTFGARVLDPSELPSGAAEEDYRDAWRDNGVGIGVDLTVARELHRAKLRRLRRPKLEALDVEYQKANDAGDLALKAQISLKRQALRDVTKDPAIDAAATVDELKNVLPAALRN